MTITSRTVTLIALPAALFALAGCGNDVPPNGIAKVGDTTITKESFNHWLGAAAKGQQQSSAPDPPDFKKCVATKQKQPAPQGSTKPTAGQVKKQCKQEYDAIKQQVVQFLVSSEWIQQEADKRKIKITDQEVRKQFEDQKKQSFPKEADYKKFLATSGMNEADLLFRVKLDVLSNKVRQKIIEGKGKVTDKDVTVYYNKNKQRFAQPERRDLTVVLTKSKSKAAQAKQALKGGDSFKSVAKKYSVDEASKNQGGKLPGVAKGQQEEALDKAVFQARKGQLSGPVKTQFGYYVFEVTKVTPAAQQSLAESKETIKNLLRSQREQKALDDFVKDFRKSYKGQTKCAGDYVIDDCDNAPSKKQDKGPASGGSPQGQQQGQQQGQGQPVQPQPQPQQPQP